MSASKAKGWSELLGTSGPASKTAATVPEEPAEPPVTVLMHTIVGNPDNPRPEEDYSDTDPEFRELKASMKEIGQLQPLAVVSRTVYEKVKADAVAQAPAKVRKLLQAADWVVVTGNRRLAAARQLGWTRIDIRVQDQLGDEDGRIDEAVIIENIHRKNLAPIKEAEYLAVMLERHGSQEKVAERIGKSQVYVSQRLALLKLAPEIREEVDAGTLKIKEARQLAGRTTDHEEQRVQVAELKARAAAPKAARERSQGPVQNPVLKPTPESVPSAAVPSVQNPVLNRPTSGSEQRADTRPESETLQQVRPEPARTTPASDATPIPDQRPEPARAVEAVEHKQPVRFPYDNPGEAALLLVKTAARDDLFDLIRILTKKGLDLDPERMREIVRSVTGDQTTNAG